MDSLEYLLEAIDELTIARKVAIPHDEARMRYPLRGNTVDSYEEFRDVIADYYSHHVSTCVVMGGHMSRTDAAQKAKKILDQEYRRQGGNNITAFNDAHDGTNGGVRGVLDIIADHLKTESVDNYIRDAFDRYVTPNSWEKKVDIMRQFISRCGDMLGSSINRNQPERYAREYDELIRAYVDSMKRTSSIFRRF